MPLHRPHQHPCGSHVITTLHVIAMLPAMSSDMPTYTSSLSSMDDVAIESAMMFVTFIFVIETGLGFGGPGTFYDAFKMSWIKQSVTKF